MRIISLGYFTVTLTMNSFIFFFLWIMPGDKTPVNLLLHGTIQVESPCNSATVLQLKDKKLQAEFFIQLDSILQVQYAGNDHREPEIFVEFDPKLLNRFLKDIDTVRLSKTGAFEKEYHFNIAPKGYTDPPSCKDKISITVNPGSCGYRVVIDNTFLVPPSWCTESQVIYYFEIKNGRIVSFGRQAAG